MILSMKDGDKDIPLIDLDRSVVRVVRLSDHKEINAPEIAAMAHPVFQKAIESALQTNIDTGVDDATILPFPPRKTPKT